MTMKYLFLVAVSSALILTACGEPRRTPDGHLMDRPKVSAYGEDEATEQDASDADDSGSADTDY